MNYHQFITTKSSHCLFFPSNVVGVVLILCQQSCCLAYIIYIQLQLNIFHPTSQHSLFIQIVVYAIDAKTCLFFTSSSITPCAPQADTCVQTSDLLLAFEVAVQPAPCYSWKLYSTRGSCLIRTDEGS